MDTKRETEARACLEAIGDLCTEIDRFHPTAVTEYQIVPLRVLLDRAEALVNGSDDARARKNAGDRSRRAGKKKTARKPRAQAKPRRVLDPRAASAPKA